MADRIPLWERERIAQQVGPIIRQVRQELGYTQAELADVVGVQERWIGELEQGRRFISFPRMLRLFEPLGISVELGTGTRFLGELEPPQRRDA